MHIKAMFSCEFIYASMSRKLGGNQARGGILLHLVQELNVATVATAKSWNIAYL